ncbi:MAG TPA: hypothetical protein VK616_00625, partial [Flavitalea sp.]|nr:hypothetical protein [Flavitalea sp.]
MPLRHGATSVFNVFNFTRTAGGAAALEYLLTDKKETFDEVIQMQLTLQYATEHIADIEIVLNNAEIGYIQEYFRANIVSRKGKIGAGLLMSYGFIRDPTYHFIRSNVIRFVMFLQGLKKKTASWKQKDLPPMLKEYQKTLEVILNYPEINNLLQKDIQQVGRAYILKTDNYLRHHFIGSFNQLLDALFSLEAITSVAIATRKYGLIFPVMNNQSEFQVDNMFHLLLTGPVKNDFGVEKHKNLIFLTGANMAGKSTFLRSIGTIVCLAHAGFPIPAQAASIQFYDYIDIRITAHDNLFTGYSNFYNEILSIRNLLTALKSGKRCFSIFDEVFSGTNLNDAVECAGIFIDKISGFRKSAIIVSSHNMQLAGRSDHKHVQYNYIESFIGNGKPVFTYKIRPG